MQRRNFLSSGVSAALTGTAALGQSPASPATSSSVIERAMEGLPHPGKNLALITPHLDDGPIFAGGTLAKRLGEGYTGYFIRTSNVEKDSYHLSLGETVLA